MRVNLTTLGMLALLAFPASVRAFPADSVLLVRHTYYSAAGDTMSVTRYDYSRDNQGKWYERESEYRRDTLDYMVYFVLDADFRFVADSIFVLDPVKGPVRSSETVQYDAGGRQVGAVIQSSDSSGYHAEMQYDAAGDMVLYILTYNSGTIDTIRYSYDSQRRKTGQVVDFNGVHVETHYAYDGSGRDILETSFNGQGDTTSILSIEYDTAGKRTREVSTHPGDTLGLLYSETRYEYDAAGNKASVKSYGKSGALVSGQTYEYRDIQIPLGLAAYRKRGGSPEEAGGTHAWARSGSVLDALGRRIHSTPGSILLFADRTTGVLSRTR